MGSALRFAASSFFAAAFSLVLVAGSQAAPAPGVPERSLELLAKGINIDHWCSSYSSETRCATRLGPSDFALMKEAGLTCVRLTLDPKVLFDEEDPAEPLAAISSVDWAVSLALGAGLGVVLDPIHGNSDDDAFEHRLARDPSFEAKVEAFWEALARRYSAVSSDKILFEIMNEPHLSTREPIDPSWWPAVQEKLAAAIRRGAPGNTIVATGEKWGGVDGLLALAPLEDANVVYSFHCYEPFIFTHQGAEWTDPLHKELSGVPYPSSPELVAPILGSMQDKKARDRVASYGAQKWDAGKVRAFVARAAEWGKRNGVAVWCGEFGVYRKSAPAADRLSWIRDMRSALESLGVGWAMWEYDSGFGLVSYRDKRHRRGLLVEPESFAALGLAMPASAAADAARREAEDPAVRFASGSSAFIVLPLVDLGALWTREPGAGSLAFAGNPGDEGGDFSSASISCAGVRDWALSSGYSFAAVGGQRYRLTSRASVEGEGRIRLEAVVYGPGDKVLAWSLGAASPAKGGGETAVVSEFTVIAGAVRIEPRWSGSGPIRAEIRSIRLERLSGK